MPLFTSVKEKRLWLLTGLVLLAIYATLGISQPVAGYLRDRGLLALFFAIGFGLVIITVIAAGIRQDSGFGYWLVIIALLAVFSLLLVRIELPEERTHLVEYGIVGLLICSALKERWRAGEYIRGLYPVAFVLTTLAGLVDEVIQFVLPGRIFDWRDVLFNAGAGLFAITATWLLHIAKARMKI